MFELFILLVFTNSVFIQIKIFSSNQSFAKLFILEFIELINSITFLDVFSEE
jgi:hypothetical protein